MARNKQKAVPKDLILDSVFHAEAKDYYAELLRLAKGYATADSYTSLYQLLLRLCEDLTPQMHFSNLFSRLSYICHKYGISNVDIQILQGVRRRCFHIDEAEITTEVFQGDLRAVANLIKCVFCREWPKVLTKNLPMNHSVPNVVATEASYSCIRVIVRTWDEKYIYAYSEYACNEVLCIDYVNGGYDGDMLYIVDLLFEGLSLNLVHVSVNAEGIYTPRLIIVMPDYLLDISTLASAFKDYGHDARNVLLSRLEPRRDTPYTVLGNLAGLFLDQIVKSVREHRRMSYAECAKVAFESDPLAFTLIPLNDKFDFHEEAHKQFDNILHVVTSEYRKYQFDLDKGLIEPSFVCETLGLAGRMDYLQSDYSRLVEQKSGKWDEFRHAHKEAHYIQMMLYQALLEYGLGIPSRNTQAFLLYSKYADGLMPEQTYQRLLREALALRNRVVSLELQCAKTGVRDVLQDIDVDSLAVNPAMTLWKDWERPRMASMLEKFQSTNDDAFSHRRLSQAYFYCFYDFLCREQLQARLVMPGNAGRAFSDLWNLPASTRHELGSLYWNLKIIRLLKDERGIVAIEFAIPAADDGFRSNFRRGDVVLVYAYADKEPDVRRQFVLRGRLREQAATHLLVELNAPQSNAAPFGDETVRYAVEHDFVEASSNRLFASLYAFLDGDADRRDLLLCQRPPRVASEPCELLGDYHTMNELVVRERQAQELFFVIGPPGSGKTSQAIRSMVEEELRQTSDGKILLMAYTNRAVDELCNMLEGLIDEHPEVLADYLRLGSPLSAGETCCNRLLCQRHDDLKDTSAVMNLLKRTRVFVGTAVTLTSQVSLFEHFTFNVAFVDEASQMLEPHMLPFFFFKCDAVPPKSDMGETKSDIEKSKSDIVADTSNHSVRKFVLVGDQKQLPAVVSQSPQLSAVQDPALRALGLTDCRNSLFERLLGRAQQAGRTDLYYMLERQGRMHPGLYGFVNAHFYQNRLRSVDLLHQTRPIEAFYPDVASFPPDSLPAILGRNRLMFFNRKPKPRGDSSKTNQAEAEWAVRCLLSLKTLYESAGRRLTSRDVGIIVPYRNQIGLLTRLMSEAGLTEFDETVADTVERYQGSQRDIILFLFTVHQSFGLNFLSAATYMEKSDSPTPYPVDRKLNVTLTRAREQLILIGNAPLLERNPLYRELISDMRKAGCYFDAAKIGK